MQIRGAGLVVARVFDDENDSDVLLFMHVVAISKTIITIIAMYVIMVTNGCLDF